MRKRQRRTRRLGPSQAQRLRATRRNEVWSWDFVMDQTESGGAFRILTLIDEHTRQCLATHVAWSIRAQDVLTVLEEVMRKHGTPEHIRSDNGPEFVAYAIQDWLAAKQIKTLYIKPGSPWENGYIESFHGKLRDECLNREVFGTQAEGSPRDHRRLAARIQRMPATQLAGVSHPGRAGRTLSNSAPASSRYAR